MNTLGKWIRQKRQDKHLTLEEFLEELKVYYKAVGRSTLSAWENGETNPPIHDNEFAEALARIFSVSVADVLKGAGFELGAAYEELDEQRRRLLEAYDSGDLERLVRVALSKLDAQHESQSHRLEMDGDEGTGSADATREARR